MMDALKKMLDEYRIPPVIEIKTKFDKTRLPKAEEVLLARLQEMSLRLPELNWDSLFIWTGLHRRQMASCCSIG